MSGDTDGWRDEGVGIPMSLEDRYLQILCWNLPHSQQQGTPAALLALVMQHACQLLNKFDVFCYSPTIPRHQHLQQCYLRASEMCCLPQQ